MTVFTRLAAAVILAGTLTSAVACGSAPPKPSVAACTKAYPSWFLASAAADKTTATPAACKGLSEDQIAQIAASYLQQTGNG